MRVLGKNVAVKVTDSTGSKTSAGGLYLAGAGETNPILKGSVIGIGNVVNTGDWSNSTLQHGETVHFSKFNATVLQTVEYGEIYVVDQAYLLIVE